MKFLKILSATVCFAGAGALLYLPSTAHADGEAAGSSETQSTFLKEDALSGVIDDAKESQKKLAASQIKDKDLESGNEDAFSYTGGGRLRFAFRHYRNIDSQQGAEDALKTSWTTDAYAWGSANWGQVFSVYARADAAYISRVTGTPYTGIGDDNRGPVLTQAFARWTPDADWSPRLTVGRQYLYLGRGLAYAAIHDGVLGEVKKLVFGFKSFASMTPPHDDNIDFSVPGFEKEGDRTFFGAEASFWVIPRTVLYIYGLFQQDKSSENTDNPRQSYHYNSNYAGGGFGSSPVDGLDVWSEIIGEWGDGFTDASRVPLEKTKVDSWAFMAGGGYRFRMPTSPVVKGAFAHGEGDPDRSRVTNTVGGDIDGNDRNFLYFGFYQSGYAFQPRLSNINIASADASFQPLEKSVWFKKLAVGGKYHYYFKDEAEGGTSDFESTSNSSDVGSEWDAYLYWQVFADTLVSARYGWFAPGNAFPEDTRDVTQYLQVTLALTF